jgi:hypothetical protein
MKLTNWITYKAAYVAVDDALDEVARDLAYGPVKFAVYHGAYNDVGVPVWDALGGDSRFDDVLKVKVKDAPPHWKNWGKVRKTRT